MSENNRYTDEAIRQANAKRILGKENTPFILSKIRELSAGRSVKANRALIVSNVKMGTLVAKELMELERQNVRNTG
jgi:pseudouridine-5'-phosphate glycosidase/pseudouridine kinase